MKTKTHKPYELTKDELKEHVFCPYASRDILTEQINKFPPGTAFENENYKKIMEYIKNKVCEKRFILLDGDIVGVGDTVNYFTLFGSTEGIIQEIKIFFSSIWGRPIFELKVPWPKKCPQTTRDGKEQKDFLWIRENYSPHLKNGHTKFEHYIQNICVYSDPVNRYNDYIEEVLSRGQKVPQRVLHKINIS